MRRRVAAVLVLAAMLLSGCKDSKGEEIHPLNPAQDLPTQAPAVNGPSNDGAVWEDTSCSPVNAKSPHKVFTCKPTLGDSEVLTWQR